MNDSFCGWWVCGNDGKTKWKWKCFMVHCVTLGECLVSGASGPWGNHWSMVGLGGKGAIGYANGKEIIICKLFLSKLLPWVFRKLHTFYNLQSLQWFSFSTWNFAENIRQSPDFWDFCWYAGLIPSNWNQSSKLWIF